MAEKRKGGVFDQVYGLVACIPEGKVVTYGQIGRVLGGGYSGRTVGFAMAAAPGGRGLPCHRVVNVKGEMAPGFCFGGPDRQRRLLRKEGVAFREDGRINMKKSQLADDELFEIMYGPAEPKASAKRRRSKTGGTKQRLRAQPPGVKKRQ